MKDRLLGSLALAGTLIILAGCGSVSTPTPEPPPAQVVLTISGSGTVVPILSAVREAFEAQTPGYRLEILPGTGTGGGVRGTVDGTLDIAAMARPPKDDEASQGIEYVAFGQSGVAILVHPGVNVGDLTATQVVEIFSGEITDWSEVGGPDLEIVLYVRDEGDSSTKALRSTLLGDVPFPEQAYVFTSQGDMQAAVSGSEASVGIGSWQSAVASDAAVNYIAIDSVTPTEPGYPMLTAIGIGYLTDRAADVQPLIDWLLSEQGQAALSEVGVLAAP